VREQGHDRGTTEGRLHPTGRAGHLPVPELAVRLLAYLVALEDAFGGYGTASDPYVLTTETTE
jgi:hypothetical protein